MNAEPNPPPDDLPPEPAAPATPQYAPGIDPYSLTGQLQIHCRALQYFGLAVIVLAFPLTWWSLTKYRVYEQRGVDLESPEQSAAITKDMDERDLLEYNERVGSYVRAWALNLARYEQQFYYPYLGEDYAGRLSNEIKYSLRSGTLVLRGWSTWTGWFGIVFGVLLLASHIVPKFVDKLEPFAWAFPWAGALVFGFFTLMTIAFFFSVPDANGDGYSQGVGLGDYLAMLGGVIVTAGATFEGMQAAAARLAALEEAGDEEPEEEEPEDSPPPKKKSRLEDW